MQNTESKLSAQLQTAQNDVVQLQRKLDTLKAEDSKRGADLEDATRQCRAAESDAASAKKRAEDVVAECQAAQSELQRQQAQVKQLASTLKTKDAQVRLARPAMPTPPTAMVSIHVEPAVEQCAC